MLEAVEDIAILVSDTVMPGSAAASWPPSPASCGRRCPSC